MVAIDEPLGGATWLHGAYLFGADERLRMLVEEVVPRPPQPDPFPNL